LPVDLTEPGFLPAFDISILNSLDVLVKVSVTKKAVFDGVMKMSLTTI
jgi:hypothetical protein